MIGGLIAGASEKERLGVLLDEALAIADAIADFAMGAHIAPVLHLLDGTRPNALSPEWLTG